MDFEKIYGTVYIGATVQAAASVLAKRQQEPAADCLIIDSHGMAAREFSACYRCGQVCSTAATELGKQFQAELAKRHIVTEEGFNPAALTPLVSKMLLDAGCDVLFMTRITHIRRENGVYLLSVVYLGSLYEIRCRHLADTTPCFETAPFLGCKRPEMRYRFTAAVRCGPQNKLPALPEDGGFTIHRGASDTEYYCTVSVETDDMAAAQEKLHTAWAGRPVEMADWKLILTASELAYEPICRENDSLWHPATAPDPVAAFEEGVRLAAIEESEPAVLPGSVVHQETLVDVVVVGLGTAGAIAAIAAGKRGLRTLGLELLDCTGGTGTVGGVPGYYYGYHGGLYCEIDSEAQRLAGETGLSFPQAKIMVLEQNFRQYGVETRFHSTVYDVLREGKRITGLRFCDNDGLHEVRCRYVIDCTAESAVCIAAGCEMIGGRDSDGCYQPYSHVSWSGGGSPANLDDGVVDPYDPLSYGKAVLHSSCSFIHLWDSYRADRYLGTAPLLGLREGKKILGEETVSFADFLAGRKVEKPVYFGLSNLDHHAKDSAFESRAYRDWNTICSMWGVNLGIAVPAGALIPKGYDGLLAAGRNVSVDHDFATGLRMKDDVQKSGETAAVLAALSMGQNVPARDVPYSILKPELQKSGCLGKNDCVAVLRQTNGGGVAPEPIGGGQWECMDIDAILAGVYFAHPGYYIWQAGAYSGTEHTRLTDALIQGMESGTPYIRENCTLALALRKHPACREALVELILDTSGRYPENTWTHNHLYAVSAVSAAGRMGLPEALDPLLVLLTDPTHAGKIPVPPRKHGGYDFMLTTKDVHFQLFTHALRSVEEILEKHPERRGEVGTKLRQITERADFSMTVSLVTREDLRLDMTDTVRKMVQNI